MKLPMQHAAGIDLEPPQAWEKRAACLTEDPELFFPIGTTETARIQAAAAKAVCQGCPVSFECLETALEQGRDHGVWGGLDEHERETFKRRERRRRSGK